MVAAAQRPDEDAPGVRVAAPALGASTLEAVVVGGRAIAHRAGKPVALELLATHRRPARPGALARAVPGVRTGQRERTGLSPRPAQAFADGLRSGRSSASCHSFEWDPLCGPGNYTLASQGGWIGGSVFTQAIDGRARRDSAR